MLRQTNHSWINYLAYRFLFNLVSLNHKPSYYALFWYLSTLSMHSSHVNHMCGFTLSLGRVALETAEQVWQWSNYFCSFFNIFCSNYADGLAKRSFPYVPKSELYIHPEWATYCHCIHSHPSKRLDLRTINRFTYRSHLRAWREPGYPKKTQRCMGRTFKLHPEKPQAGPDSKPGF